MRGDVAVVAIQQRRKPVFKIETLNLSLREMRSISWQSHLKFVKIILFLDEITTLVALARNDNVVSKDAHPTVLAKFNGVKANFEFHLKECKFKER